MRKSSSTLKSNGASDVLTLEEAAAYLRLSPEQVERMVGQQALPGRKIDDQWRFLRDALRDWLRSPSSKHVLLSQAGAFKNDPFMPELIESLKRDRARARRKRA